MNLTTYFYREALSIRIKAGLLTCTISAILPIRRLADSGFQRAEILAVLTVARQSTIFTWFPIIPF